MDKSTLSRSEFVLSGTRLRGFTLIELMVGMVVGLLILLVVAQSYTTFEGQKRTTTGSADAQENGLNALQALTIDIRQGGAGLSSSVGMACPSYIDGNYALVAAPLFPVQIVEGASGASDTIVVNYGTSFAGGNTAKILTAPTAAPTSTVAIQAPATMASTNSVLAPNDMILLSDPGSMSSCTLMQIASMTSFGATRIVAKSYPASSTYSFPTGVTYAPTESTNGGYVFDVGTLVSNQYQVLTSCNSLVVSSTLGGASTPTCTMNPQTYSAGATPLADSVVVMKAQYGIAPAGSQTINCWVNADKNNSCDTADWSQSGLLTTPANIQRIKAIKVAVVASNNHLEKTVVTSNCTSSIAANANKGPCVWPDATSQPAPVIDLSLSMAGANWSYYRYRVYTTVIPLKNVIWAAI